ncbi:Protein PEROXIN-4 [Bienertia sinuspersici]
MKFSCWSFLQLQASRARLFKEYKEVQREKSADPDIQLVCDDSNIFKWTALIKGPSETPYEGGVFQLAFAVPEQYPLQPPQVRFLTKIFHPNVHFKVMGLFLSFKVTSTKLVMRLKMIYITTLGNYQFLLGFSLKTSIFRAIILCNLVFFSIIFNMAEHFKRFISFIGL